MRKRSPWAPAPVRVCVVFLVFTSSLLASAFAPAPALMQAQQPARAAESRRQAVCMSASGKKRAAVVGAGAAGLAAAKQLRQDGHVVRVFEMSDDVGGVWHYDEKVEDDPMGNPVDARVHSSMYASLRTNLPREVMAYDALPFSEEFDERRFPHHSAVHKYLAKFADNFDLRPLISFGRKVTKLERLRDRTPSVDATCDGPQKENAFQGVAWAVEHAAAAGGGEVVREEFDVVMVCNGHYSEPWSPSFEGAELWNGITSHSHNYRNPSVFSGQRVVVIGASASGEDISRDISSTATQVYLSARSWQNPNWGAPDAAPFGPKGDIQRKRPIRRLLADGGVEFDDGSRVEQVDHLLFCTGYRYRFPFLESEDVIKVDENAVLPLYKHMLPPDTPSLAFIGLPSKVIPFPQFEAQARYVSQVWAGKVVLPAAADMAREVEEELVGKLRAGVPQKYFHVQGGAMFAYNDHLSAASGGPMTPPWRIMMHNQCSLHKRTYPEAYRDMALPTIEQYMDKIAKEQRASFSSSSSSSSSKVSAL